MRKTRLFLLGLTITVSGAACGDGSAHSGAASVPTAPDAVPAGYVHVPNGILAHVDCIHEVPSGGHAGVDGDVTIDGKIVAHHEACGHPLVKVPSVRELPASGNPGVGNGWVEAAWLNAAPGQQFVSLENTFVVPAPPTTQNDDQTIYLFPSIQGPSLSIVQPVLQWGSNVPSIPGSGYNGGNGIVGNNSSWIYAAWGVSSSGNDTVVYHSTPITVNTGDQLSASISFLTQTTSFDSWEIVATDQTTNQSTWELVDFPFDGLWNNAQAGVLEAYNVSSCNDFPASSMTAFTYPTLWQAGFGSPFSGRTLIDSASSGWSKFAPSWSGPSCSFEVGLGTASQGTTLVY
jgi:hypothetical protein